MSKIKAYLNAHPNVRSGVRVWCYSFFSMMVVSVTAFLGDVMTWATGGGDLPSATPLGKAAVAAGVSGLSGLVAWAWNRWSKTATATYVEPKG